MIIPSIDIMRGRAVQLRQGKEFVLDGGDPLELLERFSVVGEVAVVDLDAALGRGSNTELIRRMVRRSFCRVGGGIRDLDTARSWLDAGAGRIMIGTAASPELCAALPRERVIAAVDAVRGEIVVDGWRQKTGRAALDTIEGLAPFVGGFLLTQVEREGEMAGFDQKLVQAAIAAAGGARLTAAGGITNAREVTELDRWGADAQVGMALYTGQLDLAEAFAAPLTAESNSLWPTLVCDESGRALGMVWSNRESLHRAITERRGIYWSRSREELWVKGESSGNTQELLAVDLDCDRDAIRFIVHQSGAGFCHRGTRTCFRDRFDLGALERLIRERARTADPSSGTWRLLNQPGLLASKLREESAELAAAGTPDEVVHEAADLLYLLLAKLERSGSSLAQVEAELGRRRLAVSRRPMEAKT
jgi:phosphoribosyl-ATP pyrophosphohydrolase